VHTPHSTAATAATRAGQPPRRPHPLPLLHASLLRLPGITWAQGGAGLHAAGTRASAARSSCSSRRVGDGARNQRPAATTGRRPTTAWR
jgi:hypothetical protein